MNPTIVALALDGFKTSVPVGCDEWKRPGHKGGALCENSALVKQLRYKSVEQSALSSPLRILAVADGGTASKL